MLSKRLAHFEITGKLGEGGMGVVYKALDSHLNRFVAVKVLPAEKVADPERRRRFVQEARAASALNHPNIVTVYDIGNDDGVDFIAMEYVEGKTLDHAIGRKGLKVGEALKYAIQVADALAKAHAAGIIHRDLKPGNVMVTPEGRVKLLDFGLAKLTEPAALSRSDATVTVPPSTQLGMIVGTAAYMSPEQAEGKELDARSDIFSFGVLLYEMLTGKRAFRRDTAALTLAAVMHLEPPPLPPEIPDELGKIVTRCLRKDPARRFQHLDDVKVALEELKEESESGRPAVSGFPAPAGKRPMAWRAAAAVALVLLAAAGVFLWRRAHAAPLTSKDTILLADFVNTTGDAVFDDALKQGLAEQLEQSPFLSILPDERVRDTLRFMGRPPDDRVTDDAGREICQRLGVKALIEGSIAPLGSHYVLTLAAVNAATSEAIARQQVEAESKEKVLQAMGTAATQLRGKLGESLASIQKYDAPPDVTTSSLEALKAYSMARQKISAGASGDAIPYARRAVDLDPNFAEAQRLVATSYCNINEVELCAQFATKAFELRERASELERLIIEEFYYHEVTGEYDRMIETLETTTQTYPRSSDIAWNHLGNAYEQTGQFEKAAAAYREAVSLLPSALHKHNLARTYLALNRVAEAKEICAQASARQMEFTRFHHLLYSLAFLSRDKAGMQREIEWAKARPDQDLTLELQIATAAAQGQMQSARELSERRVELNLARGAKDPAAEAAAGMASNEASAGECREALEDSRKSVEMAHTALTLQSAGLVSAQCGDAGRMELAAGDLEKRYPRDSRLTQAYFPTVRALLEVRRNHAPGVVQNLSGALLFGNPTGLALRYARGETYLGQRKGADAAAEFQEVLDRRGWAPMSVFGPLAHLGLARAAALTGDLAASRKAYQDFFALWKDADQELPALKEARQEYAGLK